MWTLPAVQLADTGLARELLLRMCELHALRAGAGRALLRRHDVRARLRARGGGGVSDRRRPLHPRHRRRRDRRRAGDRRHALSRERRHSRPPRPARAAVLDRRDAERRAGGAAVHAARERGRRARARRPPPHARRADGARGGGSRRRARRDPPALRRRSRSPRRRSAPAIDLAGQVERGRRAVGERALAPVVRGGRPAGLALSADGEGDSSTHEHCSCTRSRGCSGPTRAAVLQWLRRAPLRRRRSPRRWWTSRGRATANGGDAALSGLLACDGVVRGARARGRGREAWRDANGACPAAHVDQRVIFACTRE